MDIILDLDQRRRAKSVLIGVGLAGQPVRITRNGETYVLVYKSLGLFVEVRLPEEHWQYIIKGGFSLSILQI